MATEYYVTPGGGHESQEISPSHLQVCAA